MKQKAFLITFNGLLDLITCGRYLQKQALTDVLQYKFLKKICKVYSKTLEAIPFKESFEKMFASSHLLLRKSLHFCLI